MYAIVFVSFFFTLFLIACTSAFANNLPKQAQKLTVTQIEQILKKMPKDKSVSIEKRIQFAMDIYNKIVKDNLMRMIQVEKEKQKAKEAALKKFLQRLYAKKANSIKYASLPFLRFNF
jgi:predicted metal-dependent hydrolase